MRQSYILLMTCLLFVWSQGYSKSGNSTSNNAILSTAASALFIENKGQVTDQYGNIRSDVQFKLSATKGLNLFIGNGQIHYQWYKAEKEPTARSVNKPHLIDINENTGYQMYRMDIELIGANEHAEVIKAEANDYYEMYYTATTGKNGSRANTFNKIIYMNIYPNIDWVLYTHNGQLKHEFVVKEGGKVADIRIKYSGADELKLNADGSLTAITPMGAITEAAPVSYTDELENVVSNFVLDGRILSYYVGSHSGNITIDPEIGWSTYLGGTDRDEIYDIIGDKNGNLFCTGVTYSQSNIATSGAHNVTYSSNGDGILLSMNKSGVLSWATYYGGAGNDYFTSLAIDTSGTIYAGGLTQSSNVVATIGATLGGSRDGILVSFTIAGSRLWGTYSGGNDLDHINSIACYQKTVYVVGPTKSTIGIATPGTHQNTNKGGNGDAFLIAYNSNGGVDFGTYFGGDGSDEATAISTDLSGNLIITGGTSSNNNIITTGCYQSTIQGKSEVFLTKFNNNGLQVWGTYYGGSEDDKGFDISLDKNDNIYISGRTESSTKIAINNPHQSTYSGSFDGYLAKFNTSGIPQWATYYGGADDDKPYNIYTQGDNVIIGGVTASTSSIATTNSYQGTIAGGSDAFMASFNTSTGARNWGTYFGGSDFDVLQGLYIDTIGSIYFAGVTKSTSGISTPSSHQAVSQGGSDCFITEFCNNPTITTQPSNVTETAGGNTQFTVVATGGALKYQWQYDDGTGYMNVTNSGQYSGATTNTLTVTNLTLTNNDYKYRCLLSSSSCMDTTNEAKLTVTVGINDIYKKSVKVYPNPVKDYVTLTADVTIEKATIYSITGKKIKTVSANSQTIQLDLSNLSSGMYIIKINNVHVLKVTKK